MTSLFFVDLGITGIFLIVSGHGDLLPAGLAVNLVVLGALNVAGAAWLFRPVARFLAGRGSPEAARQRTQSLAGLSAAWAAIVTLLYCTAAFSLGIFLPEAAPFAALPHTVRTGGLVWFGIVYVVYYGFYIYFLINDYLVDLKLRLWELGIRTDPRRGRLAVKIVVPLVIVMVFPSLLIVLDLTVFAELRAAQGLDMADTLALDVLASGFLLVVSLVFVMRGLLRPVRRLMPAIEASRDGAFDAIVPVTSSDELGVLTERFNEMLDGLRERAFIRETFGRYVPSSVVAELLARRAPPAPASTVATILFVDIEGFTAFAESRAPEAVLNTLNAYFAAAVEPITRHGGVVNQFQGDAILATFNVPVADPAHADRAVAAAAELSAVVAAQRFAGETLNVRVGINTGPVVAGIVGSSHRHGYTVHGDAVNVAARLEALNKELGTRILLSDSTASLLTAGCPVRRCGAFRLRGSSRHTVVFELPV